MTTLEQLCVEAAAHFDKKPEDIKPEADFFQELGINSFQALELLSRLETVFDVEIPDYEVQDVKTFADLAQVIDERL